MCPGINPGFVKVSLYSLSQGTHGVPKTQKLIIQPSLASEATRDEGISFSRQLLKLFIIRIAQRGFFNILNARS